MKKVEHSDKREVEQSNCLFQDWSNIENLEAHQISYLLYREGKTVSQIARIRNLSEAEVQVHLLQSKKIEIKNKSLVVKDNQDSMVMTAAYLACSKKEREHYLENLSGEELQEFKFRMKNDLDKLSHIDDLIVVMWTVGEIKIHSLYGSLKYFSKHPHGNMRRVCLSSMGKTGDREFLPYVLQGFRDIKPQVRQYAVIAFGKLALEEEIYMLDVLRNNPKELPYVLRTIDKVSEMIREGSNKGEIY